MGRCVKKTEEFYSAIKYYQDNIVSARETARLFGFSKDLITNYLRDNDLLRVKKDNSYNEYYFDIIDTEEKAYWLGFIFADGNIQHGNKNSLDITLKESDIGHLIKFKNSINYHGDIKIRKIGEKYSACRITLHGSHLVESLMLLGCIPRKSLVLKFPNIPQCLEKHFIRGYFDGDGSVYTYQRKDCVNPTLCLDILGTEDMLNHIQNHFILNLNSRKVSLYTQKINIYDYKKAFKEAFKILNYLYSDSSVYLDRKYEKFNEYCRLTSM